MSRSPRFNALLAAGFACSSLVWLGATAPVDAGNGKGCTTWYVQSGGSGDGTRQHQPFGSLGDAEAASTSCDTIVVLPSDVPLDGGIILKDGQRLVGRADDPAEKVDADSTSGMYSLVANSTGAERDGHAVTCLGSCSIDRIWIVEAYRSGVLAIDVVGDFDVRRSRVTNYTTSGDTFPDGSGPRPYFGIQYGTSSDARVAVRDSVVEDGRGSGIRVATAGSAQVSSEVRAVHVRDLSVDSAANGIAILTSESSRQDVVVTSSVVADVPFGPEGGAAVALVASGAQGSVIDATVRGNTIDTDNAGIVLVTTADGPNQGSAVVTHNDVRATGVGIIGVFESASAPDVDRMTVRHNTVEIGGEQSRGIEVIVGDNLDPRPADHRGEWIITHNDISVIGQPGLPSNGIEMSYESTTLEDRATIAHNTIVGDEAAALGSGIQVVTQGEAGREPETVLAVRHNDIRMSGELGSGMSFLALAGFIGPPIVPGWDIGMLLEHNCVQDTDFGFMVSDVTGLGFSEETFDLGGGALGSRGFNSFLRADADIVYLPPFFPAPGTAPASVLVAENNYWDADNPIAADPLEAFVLDLVGGAMTDTEPYRTNGPDSCGL